jgi:hypothetical protein
MSEEWHWNRTSPHFLEGPVKRPTGS